MRKMRYTEKSNSLLKTEIDNIKTITKANISYLQRSPLLPLKLLAWAKFDEIAFNGISVIANLTDDENIRSIGSCNFTIYSVAKGSSWNETLVGSKAGVYTSNGFVASFTSAELPSMIGDVTLKMVVKANRMSKKYSFMGYFNHLGSLQFMTKNKNKIAFLEISKLDE